MRLTALPGNELHAAVSPDGSRVAFTHERGGRAQVAIVPIVVNDADNVATDVSRDGRSVLFTSDLSGEPRIYTVSIDGGEPVEIEHDLGTGDGARWSPDGTRIAFVSSASGVYDIYTMAADGGPVTRVTDSEAREGWPTWSPDGGTLYFSAADGDVDLWIERF